MVTDAAAIAHLDWTPRVPCAMRLCWPRHQAVWIFDAVCHQSMPRLSCESCRVAFLRWVDGGEVVCRCGWSGHLGDHVFFEWLW